MSRAFGFKRLGGHALAPLIDMANHAPVSNAEVAYSTDTGRVNLVTNKQVWLFVCVCVVQRVTGRLTRRCSLVRELRFVCVGLAPASRQWGSPQYASCSQL